MGLVERTSAGSRLKIMGGRASGPSPLKTCLRSLLSFSRKQQDVNSLECHDLMCKVRQVVVVGGVRRSALISLSDLDDEIRHAKSGEWYKSEKQRNVANNSVSAEHHPQMGTFVHDGWPCTTRSREGRASSTVMRRTDRSHVMVAVRQDTWGTNPCSEIILRPYQFCNLSSLSCGKATHSTL